MKSFIKKIRNQKGFSLLENILAAVLLSACLFGGMTVMQNVTANSVNIDLSSIATELANEKVEMVIADKTYNGFDVVETNYYQQETDLGAYAMTRFVTVTEVDPDDLTTGVEGSGVKKVDVTVSWGSADHQRITVSTLISDVS
ncbi:MAG: hypothetical protein HQM16_03260 [Deltaproteobacteria bacterium]|nr:hypothetical protein [Deltaproteobacteria bacterium]